MKKILVALDYNSSAQKVAEAGFAVAKTSDAELILVHVITEPAYYAMEFSPIMGYQDRNPGGTTAVVETIKKQAEVFLEASVKHLGDDRIKTKILEGETAESILQFSNKWKADMIVMGSHRHKGINRLLVTDIAVYTLKHTKIPLLTIPTDD